MKIKKFSRCLAVAALLVTAFIFFNSSRTAEVSAHASDGISGLAGRILAALGINMDADTVSFIVRKTAHFTEYFLLSALAYLTVHFYKNKPNPYFPLVVAPAYCFLVAVIDEFAVQRFSVGRSPEWGDVGIDLTGALAAALLIHIVVRAKNRRANRPKG